MSRITFRVTRSVFMNSVREVSQRRQRKFVNAQLAKLFKTASARMDARRNGKTAWDLAQRAFWGTAGNRTVRIAAARKVVQSFAK